MLLAQSLKYVYGLSIHMLKDLLHIQIIVAFGLVHDLLQKFRNSPTLRIAVTVDMIATGTDVGGSHAGHGLSVREI